MLLRATWWAGIGLLILLAHITAFGGILGYHIDIPVGDKPGAVVAGDFDDDGDGDLAMVDKGSAIGVADSIVVLKNDGDGVFQIYSSCRVGDYPFALCAADFDGDADVDLAVVNRADWTVSILLNDGHGEFHVNSVHAAGQGPCTIYPADFDGDGDADLVIGDALTPDIYIMRNAGNGTFPQRVKYGVSESVRSVSAAELDGTSGYDVMAVTAAGVDILMNDGSGSFPSQIHYGMVGAPFAGCTIDVDGDRDADLAIADVTESKLYIRYNNGYGAFGDAVGFVAGFSPYALTAADIDRDGDGDIIIVDEWDGRVAVLLNDGTGQFISEGIYDTGDRTAWVASADLDGDGDGDVVTANPTSHDISILFNQTYNGKAAVDPGIVHAIDAYGPGPLPGAAYAGDFDGGFLVEDIDPFTVRVNDNIMPSSFILINDHPTIPGEVVQMTVNVADVVRGYGLLWETAPHIYTVSGQFTDGAPFKVGGDLVIVGLIPGDANSDGAVSIGDPVYLINYLFHEGTPPRLDPVADANGDSLADLSDVTYLINYIFREGPAPVPGQ